MRGTRRPGAVGGAMAVATKETRELLRDPITLGVAFLVPLILLFIFGYALRLDVREVPVSAVDLDGTPASREFVDRIDRSEEFRVVHRASDGDAAAAALDRGRARVAVVVPAGFGRDLAGGRRVRVQSLVDGSFSATAQVVVGYLDALASSFRPPVVGPGPRDPEATPVRVETRVWYNPELESVISVVPGLFAVILMAFPPLLTALAIVREKERGSIRSVALSPLPPWAFVTGKLVPYAAIAFASMAMVVALGAGLFGVPFRGGPTFLLLVSGLYVVATLGIGLFVSSITRTQVVALLLVLVLTVMPSFLFSGFLYPIHAMPEPLQWYTRLYPGRYFVAISRGVFLKGVGLEALGGQVAALGLYAAAMFGFATLRFGRWSA